MNCIHHLRKHNTTTYEPTLLAKRKQSPQGIETLPQAEVCETDACKKYAKTVLSNFNPNYQTLDPCDDFDLYTCEGFRQTHEPKPWKSNVGTMELIREEVDDILAGLLNGTVPYKTSRNATANLKTVELSNYKAMRTVWDICMDEDAIRAYGVKPIQPILEEFEKRFPVKGAQLTSASKDELTDLAIWLYHHGGPSLWSAGSTVCLCPSCCLI
jgi:endothelin-converting enzyme